MESLVFFSLEQCQEQEGDRKTFIACAVVSEAYHDWSGEAVGAQLRVNFTLKLLLSQNFCNLPLMRFISFASNIGTAAAVPAGPAPAPLMWAYLKAQNSRNSEGRESLTLLIYLG